ncbi:MAG: hypothetical protein KGL95_00670 [Patescibacteria group bacterium]|nr:hypothetical protein [Patescibacteria group bacterium]
MKKTLYLVIALAFVLGITLGHSTNVTAQQTSIPSWVKNTALWWGQGQISDAEFLKAIQWMVNNGIIEVSPVQTNQTSSSPSPTLSPIDASMPTSDLLGPMWKVYPPTPSNLLNTNDAAHSIQQVFEDTAASPPSIVTVDEADFASKSQAMSAYYNIGPSLSQNIPEFNQLRNNPGDICSSTDQVMGSGEAIIVSCYTGVMVWHIQSTGGAALEGDTEKIIEHVMNYVK